MNKTKISNISKYFIRISRERVPKSLRDSNRGRWNKKHEMIHHWIEHINTGSRQHKKLLSHIDTFGAARCADTLDNLQPLLEWLKVEPSFEPMVPNHALRAAASTIMKNEAVGEPIKHDLSGDLPNQENSKLKKEEPVKIETRSTVPNNSLRAAVSTIRQQEDRRSFHIAAMERRRKERRDQMYMQNRRTPKNSVRSLKSKNQAMENSKSDKFCQLCASSEKLIFEPPKIYCTPCDTRIKRNTIYFTVEEGETHRYFCKPCYNKSKGDTILAEGTSIPKAKLEKKKNDEKIEEWWVQCDKCKAWQHQICALFNREINEGEQAEYICPNCVDENERKQSDVLGAKELPRTFLSDHIEQRLFKRLKEERIERAKLQGTSYDEIPSAESLVVRVVSSVDKKLEVKTRFREYFRDDNFPTEFPYKSKMIMLFQKIEGAEVCLLAQCVQEFGSECSFPNQRCVYLAFLDSVKYFRPDIKSANGESLRTFVYQEILISYLEYCKLRGFTSCYLWSCPPSSKKVDYILYCHPQNQKTPSTKKLRKWHLAWLRKAAKEGIVVKTTNLYDQFFLQTGECRAKVTAARLPYFDGDYWPRKAESIIYQMSQEDDREKENKNAVVTKSDIKEPGQSDVSRNASKDQRLMQKLGKSVHSMKENLIVVHLQHCCTHCSTVIVTGNRWICNQCKNFQLCDRCYESEQKREHSERHPVNRKKKHDSYTVEINNIPVDTKDKDEILECENFETGYKFIIFCEKRHYQHDTLRRTKFSYKMALHHLHQCFKRNCNACRLDIDNNQGYRCKGCNYDLCNACYNKEGTVNHPHKLTNLSALADENAQNKEARQQVL